MMGAKRTPMMDRRNELAARAKADEARAAAELASITDRRYKGGQYVPTPFPAPHDVAWELSEKEADALASAYLASTPFGNAWRLPPAVMRTAALVYLFRNSGMLEVGGPFLTAHGNAVRKAVIGQRDL